MVVHDNLSIHEVSRITGIDRTLIREWLNLYKNHGTKYLKPGINSYSYEFKKKVWNKMQHHCKKMGFDIQ